MKEKIINKLISFLPSKDNKIKNVIFVVSCALFFAYSFSIPTFSNRYPFNYLSIALCGLMCVAMGVYVLLYGKFKIDIFSMMLILLNIIILISHIINMNFAQMPKTIILMSIVAFFIYHFISEYKEKSLFLNLVLISGLLFSVVYVIHYGGDIFKLENISDGGRLGFFFDNQNEISKEFGFFCVLSFSSLMWQKKIVLKIISAISMVIFMFLILTTGSISNIFTTLLVIAICLILLQKTKKRKIIFLISSIAVVGLFFAFIQLPFMSYFKTRIYNIFSTLFEKGADGFDNSSYNRLDSAIVSFAVGINKVLFGYGYMSSMYYTIENIQAHNNFAEIFIDYGIFALFIYEFLVIFPLVSELKEKEKTYIFPIMFYMLIFQLFLTTYYKKFEYIFFSCVFAMLDNEIKTRFVIFDSSVFNKDKKKKRILEIIPSLNIVGGAETFFVDFINECKKSYSDKIDVKVVILYDEENKSLFDILRSDGIEFLTLSKKNGIDFKCSFKLREIIYNYNPDIIHSHLMSLLSLKLALPLGRKDIKKYHTIHHNVGDNDFNQRFLSHLIKTKYIKPICVAENASIQYGELTNTMVDFIDNGINVEKYQCFKPLKERKNDFLLVGRFVKVKNYKFVLEAINECQELKQYKYILLGDGDLLNDCKKYVSDNNLNDIIDFKGHVDNVNEYMKDSKALIVPSLNEGNPIVINEAIVSGMAVIANNVGGIPNLLDNNKLGFLVNIGNDNELEHSMLTVMNMIKLMNWKTHLLKK